MEITVYVADTIQVVEKERKKYEKEYAEACRTFKKKLNEYSRYVQKQTKSKKMNTLKSPPYPPSNKTDVFEDAILVLKAHIDTTIKMDDDEYKAMLNEVTNHTVAMNTTVRSLKATKY